LSAENCNVASVVTLILTLTRQFFSREIFPSHVKLFVENDAVAALASGTMGKLHGCVLIAGTGTIAYGFTSDGREARAAGAGPVLGDWGRLVKRTTFSYVYMTVAIIKEN